MALNENLTKLHLNRWMVASIAYHMKTELQNDIFVFFEGEERNTRAETDYVEVRIDGPNIKNPSKGFYWIDCEVNVLITSVVNDNNLYGIYKDVGLVVKAMDNCLPIYRYGNGPDDDQSWLGCMQLVNDRRNSLLVAHMGRKLIESPLMIATVEGHYKMNLCMEDV